MCHKQQMLSVGRTHDAVSIFLDNSLFNIPLHKVWQINQNNDKYPNNIYKVPVVGEDF